jgi:hypothetical protein
MYTVSSRVRNASTFAHIVHPHCELILILSQAETSKTVATQPKLRYFPAGTSKLRPLCATTANVVPSPAINKYNNNNQSKI